MHEGCPRLHSKKEYVFNKYTHEGCPRLHSEKEYVFNKYTLDINECVKSMVQKLYTVKRDVVLQLALQFFYSHTIS